MQTLFSLIESPFHPDFSVLYQKLGIAAQKQSKGPGSNISLSNK